MSVTTLTTPSDPAVLTFTLVVTDSLGLSDLTPDTVVITVNNQPPVANAGSNQSVKVTAQLGLAVASRAREERESGGVESGKAALNTPISPVFRAEALLRRLA